MIASQLSVHLLVNIASTLYQPTPINSRGRKKKMIEIPKYKLAAI